MSDQSNLPEFRKYGNIKDITIKKNIYINDNKVKYEYYYISFTELVEKEKEIKGFLKNKIITITEEVKQIIPFSFKTLGDAKDFAQYLPGMSLKGFRFFKTFTEYAINISYETYKIQVESIEPVIYIKFIKDTEHPRVYERQQHDGITKYYENDLDINREPSGEFYQYNELIVDYFFTDASYDTVSKHIIPNAKYKNISEIKNFENENTHKFILIEQ